MKKLLYILSAIPAIGSLTVINKVEPYVLGMPFVLFWTILWVFLTSIFLLIVNKLDPANKGGEQ
ncbi:MULTISPECIES: DUF3311 domain-containing protein [unclassified Bacillus (in: firmicutes)]|nr:MULTISPECIES: DUF3311 domain-containing protein [unclassified Bacillus (in: firmicutes)]PEJ49369.1 hypothetical protein CN692_23270 [Bacillus sp. AFS002410]PEL13446.1 hypothetical protein CN601_04705 [Bacillus sp. AFS017336]